MNSIRIEMTMNYNKQIKLYEKLVVYKKYKNDKKRTKLLCHAQ